LVRLAKLWSVTKRPVKEWIKKSWIPTIFSVCWYTDGSFSLIQRILAAENTGDKLAPDRW
jgi:hypothetical protein